MHDVMIIGAGPAGLSAAIYAGRYKLDTVLVTREAGGLAATAHKIGNYPSYKEISGPELMDRMLEHAKSLGVKVVYENVKRLDKNDTFIARTDSGNDITSKKVIFSTGSRHKKLGIPGEDRFLGKGVSYCATCDAGFFRDKVVAVIGGGDNALTSALVLSEHAKEVMIIYRKAEFTRAEKVWIDAVEKDPKIKAVFEDELDEIIGEKAVTGIKLKSGKDIALDGVFIEIGSIPNTALLEGLDVRFSGNFIIVDAAQKTNVAGLYAAGDVTTNSNGFQQIITAAAEGAIAANSVFKALQSLPDPS